MRTLACGLANPASGMPCIQARGCESQYGQSIEIELVLELEIKRTFMECGMAGVAVVALHCSVDLSCCSERLHGLHLLLPEVVETVVARELQCKS